MNFSRLFWQRLSFFTLFMVVVIHLRPPSFWSKTQLLFNYDFGFQRRALYGEFLTWFMPYEVTALEIHWVAFLTSAVAIIGLVVFVWRAFAKTETTMPLILLFASSFGFAVFVGNTGYLDAILLVLVLLCFALPVQNMTWIIARIVLLGLGAMVHENVLPYFSVLVAFDVWIRRADLPFTPRAAVALAPVATTLIAVYLVFEFGYHPFAIAAEVLESLDVRSSDFAIRTATLEPVVEFPSDREKPLDPVWDDPLYKFRLYAYGGTGALLLGLQLFLVLKATNILGVMDRIFAFGAVVAPLSLLLVAFDVSRFFGIACINLFMLAALILRVRPEFSGRLATVFSVPVVLMIVVLNSQIALRPLNSQTSLIQMFPGVFLPQLQWIVPPEGVRTLIDPQFWGDNLCEGAPGDGPKFYCIEEDSKELELLE